MSKEGIGKIEEGKCVTMEIDRQKNKITWKVNDGRFKS